ncbi:hypothetical protein V6D40_03155 [Corynebacterium sp. Q4381]|uniref:hypothetical protein n=1 Tax=Corynebacterium sp. Marseille-Q4381 TaxID=3121597 RepID=UPI002FE61B14
MDSSKATNYLLSRKNQVGLLVAILVVVLHIAFNFGPLWPVAAIAAYGAGAVLTPPPKQRALPSATTPTPTLLDDALNRTAAQLRQAAAPAAVVRQAQELESNVRFVLGEWDHLTPTPEHRQTMWDVVKVYYPEVTQTYLAAPQRQDPRAVAVVTDSLSTLTSAVGRIKQGIVDDNLRAMDSQAKFLRNQLGALPGLDGGEEIAGRYD